MSSNTALGRPKVVAIPAYYHTYHPNLRLRTLVSDGNYYDYAFGEFNNDLISAKHSTEAKLEFTVPAGVTPDQLRITAPDQSGVSVVSFHDKRT